MDFEWTPQQREYREAVVAFAERELNDDLVRRDAEQEFSREAWDKCAEFGLQGLSVPEAYGGQGGDCLTVVVAMEALGYACRDSGLVFGLNAHMWSCQTPIIVFGTEEQKQRYLPGLCDGSLIGVQCMTEPGSGSDAFSLDSTADRQGEGYRLNGSKSFVTNGPVADLFLVFASTEPAMGFAGISAFLVEADTPGVSVGPPLSKMGLRTTPMSELAFRDAAVPAGARLGAPGAGMAIFSTSMDWERSFILAGAIGVMERQLDRCIAYARERHQFGKPIGSFQSVSNKIVDMKVRLETARLLLYRLAWQKDEGTSTGLSSAMVKLYLSECLVQSSLEAVQLHGGYGYLTDHEVERDVRDALASRIYSGTSEMQRTIISRHLGL